MKQITAKFVSFAEWWTEAKLTVC